MVLSNYSSVMIFSRDDYAYFRFSIFSKISEEFNMLKIHATYILVHDHLN